MNFIGQESAQKLRGGYYTDQRLARFLVTWVLEGRPERVFEPGCGDGAFLEALEDLAPASPIEVDACEIDAKEAAQARVRTETYRRIRARVSTEDFLWWMLRRSSAEPGFDAVVGNPPYIRYQYLSETQQDLAERLFGLLGLRFTRHTNAWVPFLLGSLHLLRPGGRLGMVIPAELLHVLHAQSARDFLLRQCTRTLVLDLEELCFGDALQGVVLLLAEKRAATGDALGKLAITAIRDSSELDRPASSWFDRAEWIDGDTLDRKWMPALLTSTERQLLGRLRCDPRVQPFGSLADVDVGIVTGANKFFLVPDAVVDQFDLAAWARPMFGRSEHVKGVIYGARDHRQNRSQGLPTNFLDFGTTPRSGLTHGALRYVEMGEEERLPQRFKCRIREPWYAVPSVSAAPVAMLKRSHNLPRLVLNRFGALTTDTAYRIRPTRLCGTRLVASFVNSLTALSAELEGRHYGGGVLELVPSEIERILIPLPPSRQRIDLTELDRSFRLGVEPEQILTRQDSRILAALGVNKADRATIQSAWVRLRQRRQRDSEPDDRGDGA